MAKEGYSESISQILLNQLLAERFGSIKWERVINDPPDYWLTIDCKKKYAVEVTSSKIFRKTPDNKRIIQNTFISSVFKFGEEIESYTIARGLLEGTYTLCFKKPIPDEGYRKHKNNIKKYVIDYLKETKDLSKTEATSVYINGYELFDIEKISNDCNAFYALPKAKAIFINTPENDLVIGNLLQHAIDDKMNKMKSIEEKKILIYFDSYHLSEVDNYFRCFSKLNNVKFYDSIFVVLNGEKVITLYSELISAM